MNSMHNSFNGSGGYPSGYPGYVPPPSALPYYNGYPGEFNHSSNPYYGKPGGPVPPGYSSNVTNYSGPVNNSSMYYQQFGLGYQYGYGKYSIAYSEGGIHPSSIGALQSPTTDLGLTGSMFSKTKYSTAHSNNSSTTITNAAQSHVSTSTLLSPATSNTPSPGPHNVPPAVKGPGTTPSPPVESSEGKKDLEKLKRCQVCGQVFRLMSECLAHMKTAHETPHSVYNLSHHGGHAPTNSSTISAGLGPSRHIGIGTPDSPLMALERMGWGEKQSILRPGQPSSPLTSAFVPGQSNQSPCLPHPHPSGAVYGHPMSHPGSRLSSPLQHTLSTPVGFSQQRIASPNCTSPSVSEINTYAVTNEGASADIVSKSRKNSCYSMSSIIGESAAKDDAPPTAPKLTSEEQVDSKSIIADSQMKETDSAKNLSSEKYDEISNTSPSKTGDTDKVVSLKTEDQSYRKFFQSQQVVEHETSPENEPCEQVKIKDECEEVSQEPIKKENSPMSTTVKTEQSKDLSVGDPDSTNSEQLKGEKGTSVEESASQFSVQSESTGSQTQLSSTMFSSSIQKSSGYAQWPANTNGPYQFTPSTENVVHTSSFSSSIVSTGSMTTGYQSMGQPYSSPYPPGNGPPSFNPHEHMIRSATPNAMAHPQGSNWFPGSNPRSDSKPPWANWTGPNGQPYGVYGYPATVNKSGVHSIQGPHMHSVQSAYMHPTSQVKSSSQPVSQFQVAYPSSGVSNTKLLGESQFQNKTGSKCKGRTSNVGSSKKSLVRIGPKCKTLAFRQKAYAEELESMKSSCNNTTEVLHSLSTSVDDGSDSSDSDLGDKPILTVLKPKRRGSFGQDGSIVAPKRVKIAHQVKERQRKRYKELQEQMRLCELEEQLIAQKIEEADEQPSPLANVLLQSSILLSDKKVDGSEVVQQSIAFIKAERNLLNSDDSSFSDFDKCQLGNATRRSMPKRTGSKILHNDNSVHIREFGRQRYPKKLRAKDFKWSQYVKNNRYWCGDCAHGLKNQKDAVNHTEERCKANCLYMLECYVIVKDVQYHPIYGQKVQELLEEYQIDGQHNCSTCGEIFEKKSDYLVHVDSHKDFMPWECTICGTRFKIRGSLKEHLRYTHMKGRVPCLKCNKVFPTSTLLRQHVKVHTQHYKYKSGKNREEELRAAMEATAGALEPSGSVASPEDNDRLSSQEANEYRNWCKLMEINAMKNIATTGASVAGVNLQLEEDDDDRNDDSMSGEDVSIGHYDYHTERGMMYS